MQSSHNVTTAMLPQSIKATLSASGTAAMSCSHVIQSFASVCLTATCFVMQAAVSAAAATVLRNYAASPQDLENTAAVMPGRDPQQVRIDCVYALCQWRDDVARREDEGQLRYVLICSLLCTSANNTVMSATANKLHFTVIWKLLFSLPHRCCHLQSMHFCRSLHVQLPDAVTLILCNTPVICKSTHTQQVCQRPMTGPRTVYVCQPPTQYQSYRASYCSSSLVSKQLVI